MLEYSSVPVVSVTITDTVRAVGGQFKQARFRPQPMCAALTLRTAVVRTLHIPIRVWCGPPRSRIEKAILNQRQIRESARDSLIPMIPALRIGSAVLAEVGDSHRGSCPQWRLWRRKTPFRANAGMLNRRLKSTGSLQEAGLYLKRCRRMAGLRLSRDRRGRAKEDGAGRVRGFRPTNNREGTCFRRWLKPRQRQGSIRRDPARSGRAGDARGDSRFFLPTRVDEP